MFKTLNKQLPDLTYGIACRSGHALSMLPNETLTARSSQHILIVFSRFLDNFQERILYVNSTGAEFTY
jgi:hypothetical protein